MATFLNLPAEYSNLGHAEGETTTFGDKDAGKRANENAENSPNASAVESLVRPAKKPRQAIPTRSALPRVNSSRLRTAADRKALESTVPSPLKMISETIRSPSRSLISSIFSSGVKAIASMSGIRSPLPSAKKAGRRSIANAGTPSATGTGAIVKDGLSNETTVTAAPAAPTMVSVFETGFSVDEERVIAIVANLKCKNKWDNKEKTAKQVAVIADLRAALKTCFDETKAVKDKAVAVETNLSGNLQRIISEFAASRQQVSQLSREEVRLRQELKDLASSVKDLQSERSETLQRAFDAEARCGRLEADLSATESKRAATEEETRRQRDEMEIARADAAQAVVALKEEHEQRVEQLLSGYKDEVQTLRSELGRSSVGKAEISKAAAEQREELFNAQSMVRELRAELDRKSADIDDAKTQLCGARDALGCKDADMRAALQSLQELQRVTAEEKTQLRSEINNLQGKLVHFEDDRLSCASQLATKIEEISSYMRDIDRLKEKLAQREEDLRSSKDDHILLDVEKDLRVRAEIREENERRERIAATAQLLATQTECNERIHGIELKAAGAVDALKQTLSEMATIKDALEKELSEASNTAAGRLSEIHSLKKELETASANSEAQKEVSELKGQMEILKRRLNDKENLQIVEGTHAASKIRELEGLLVEAENQRRKLRNIIAELKGNVRVFARVRPFLPSDGVDTSAHPESSIIVSGDSSSVRIRSASEKVEDKLFTFDKTFGPSASQESVFSDVSEFVQSALDGYNVCLFSYGQTGSGKTHTMTGSGNGSMKGIIPRAMQQVGTYKNELESKGWEYFMEVSFIEIYNETIRDLLRGSYAEEVKHEIKRDANGSTVVSDVTMCSVDPNDIDQMDAIMEKAARHRSVASTAMNEQSSRSHSVFTLHLRAKNAEQGVMLKGNLSLVDLAGSERLDRSQATGSRLKETVAINKSLSSLVDVFTAIANKQSHIPFRNSKLTFLLQPALSGDGKTLMLVNLSPTEDSFNESLCSLRFASQVNQCELGKPKRQIQEAPIERPSSEVKSTVPNTPSSQAKKIAKYR